MTSCYNHIMRAKSPKAFSLLLFARVMSHPCAAPFRDHLFREVEGYTDRDFLCHSLSEFAKEVIINTFSSDTAIHRLRRVFLEPLLFFDDLGLVARALRMLDYIRATFCLSLPCRHYEFRKALMMCDRSPAWADALTYLELEASQDLVVMTAKMHAVVPEYLWGLLDPGTKDLSPYYRDLRLHTRRQRDRRKRAEYPELRRQLVDHALSHPGFSPPPVELPAPGVLPLEEPLPCSPWVSVPCGREKGKRQILACFTP